MPRIQQLLRPQRRTTGTALVLPVVGLALAGVAFYAHARLATPEGAPTATPAPAAATQALPAPAAKPGARVLPTPAPARQPAFGPGPAGPPTARRGSVATHPVGPNCEE